MKNIFTAAAATAVLSLAPAAQAATYNYQQAYNVAGNQINEVDNFVPLTDDVTRTRAHAEIDAGASSTFAIDRETGVMKLGASVVHDNGLVGQFALTKLELREQFTVTGDGTVTFTFDVDGLLSAQSEGGFTQVDAFMRLSNYSGPSAAGQLTEEETLSVAMAMLGGIDTVRRTIDGVTTDVVDITPGVLSAVHPMGRTLSLDFDVVDTQVFRFDVGMTAQSRASNAPGFLDADFLSTAYLSYAVTDGVTIAASDDLFLSEAVGRVADPGAAVPVPAPLGLLAAGLGALGLMRRRR